MNETEMVYFVLMHIKFIIQLSIFQVALNNMCHIPMVCEIECAAETVCVFLLYLFQFNDMIVEQAFFYK